jgi:sugar lactone lactonase YvrE
LDIMKYGLMLILISLLLFTACENGLGEEDSYVKVPVIFGSGYDTGTINIVFTDSYFSKSIVSGLNNPNGIAMDEEEGILFWTEWGSGRIVRYDLKKKEQTIIVSGLTFPEEIDFDPIERKIYWCNSVSSTINRCNEWGGSIEILLTNLDGLITPMGISLDINSRHIYFTDSNAGKIQRCNIDGTGLIIVTNTPNAPVAIAYNQALDKIYWNDVVSNEIRRSNSDGSNQELLNNALLNPKGLAFDEENNYLYYTYNVELHRCNLDGSQDQTILSTVGIIPFIEYGYYPLDLNNNISFPEFPSSSF